jgi:hypothetical protein
LQLEDVKQGKSGEELEQVLKEHPECKDFITKYMYMIDDDIFDWPRDYKELKLNEDCMFFNHSCDPNCGFNSLDSGLVIAIKDIEVYFLSFNFNF